MARKENKIEIKQGLASWMGTYGDMVTLLLCFFVLLFASTEVDAEKFKQLAASFARNSFVVMPEQTNGMMDALGNGIIEMPEAEGESDQENKFEEDARKELESIEKDFKTYFAENNLEAKVEVERHDEFITLNFKDGILFDSGKGEIKQNAIKMLSMISDKILQYPENDIKIEGHTDNMPIRTERFPNNWYLSAARAISVATYFIEVKNFSPNRMSTEGYGEYRPKVPNDTAQNRSINRRVEIKIISKYYSGDNI